MHHELNIRTPVRYVYFQPDTISVHSDQYLLFVALNSAAISSLALQKYRDGYSFSSFFITEEFSADLFVLQDSCWLDRFFCLL